MLAQEAYDLGRSVGAWLAPLLVAWLAVAGWGAWRAEENKLRSGLRYAWHWRTLSVSGLLWAVSLLGSV